MQKKERFKIEFSKDLLDSPEFKNTNPDELVFLNLDYLEEDDNFDTKLVYKNGRRQKIGMPFNELKAEYMLAIQGLESYVRNFNNYCDQYIG